MPKGQARVKRIYDVSYDVFLWLEDRAARTGRAVVREVEAILIAAMKRDVRNQLRERPKMDSVDDDPSHTQSDLPLGWAEYALNMGYDSDDVEWLWGAFKKTNYPPYSRELFAQFVRGRPAI